MDMQTNSQYITISELSQLTGVNSVTLRAWERRYGLLKPQRSAKGHRLYLKDDIDKISSILAWINKGVSVGKVKPLLSNGTELHSVDISEQWNHYQKALQAAALDFNESKIMAIYQKITKQYPLSTCITYCFKPLFELLDNTPQASSAQYFLSACLKSRMQHSLIALSKGINKNSQTCVLTTHMASTSWKIWITALLVQEKGIKVSVFDDIPNIEACLQMITDMSCDYAIIYTESTEDKFAAQHIQHIKKCNHLYLAGHKLWLVKEHAKLSPINKKVLLNPFDMCEAVF